MKTLKSLFATVSVLFCSIAVNANPIEIGGIWYNLQDSNTKQAEVACNSSDGYIGDITIPESVSFDGVEYAVTSIGNNAFKDCRSLNSVSIPESVTSIGFKAFFGCENLTEITIPGSVASIRSSAFEDCISLTTITIPESSKLTSIVDYTFRGCCRLTEITIPDSVMSVGANAFEGCWSLTSITIPKNVTKIENYAFNDCNSLKEIIIEDGCETLMLGYNASYSAWSMGQGLFYDCPLETIYLGRNLNYRSKGDWGYSPFYNQTKLTSVTIGDSVTHIGYYAFSGCSSLTEIIIPKSVTVICDDAFSGCYSLSIITIGENVRNIGEYAFQNCRNLTSISIPKGVEGIGNYVFDNCENLKEVIFEDGGGTLSLGCNDYYSSGGGDGLFDDCPLESVYLGRKISYNSGSSYGYSPFNNRTQLTTVVIGDSVTSIGDNAFRWCTSLASLTIPENVTSIGKGAFWNCQNLTSVTIPKSVTRIWAEAFAGCYNLTTVNISDIAAWCKIDFSESSSNPFCHAKNICLNGETVTELIIPEGITSVKNYAFYNCSSLTSVVIPEGVSNIGREAFYNCDSLTTIMLPEKLEYIDNGAFADCAELLDVYCYAKSIPSTHSNVFGWSSTEYATLHVPASAMESYQTTVPWNSFGKFEAIKVPVEEIFPDKTVVTLEEGKTLTLCATVTPEDATDASVVWSSGNEEVATVDEDGNVTAIALGTTIITVTSRENSEINALCEVTVVPARYVITYLIDDEVFATDTLTRGILVEVIDDPVKEGYTFSGWIEVPEIMPAEDITISGTFMVNKYLVTFKIGDEVIASDSLEYGADIVAPVAPEKEGYTFNGWGEVVEVVPAHDVTYESSYIVNVYNIYYYIEEELVHTEEVAYGEEIPVYVYVPTDKEGEFLGWEGDAYETMPAHDVTYVGYLDTAIKEIMLNGEDLMFYDLQGRRVLDVENMKGGLYIVNGRKVMIKN